jgi:hypothetical protein
MTSKLLVTTGGRVPNLMDGPRTLLIVEHLLDAHESLDRKEKTVAPAMNALGMPAFQPADAAIRL